MHRTSTNDEEEIELQCNFRDLRVTISGPASQASELLRHITRLGRASSPAPTDNSFVVVPQEPDLGSSRPATVSSSSLPGPRLETRSEIEATFERCPGSYLSQASRLCGSVSSGRDRVQRAWAAGQWAKAVKERRIHSPNRTPALDLRSRYYAVVGAPGLSRPTIFRSSTSYWRAIGSLQGSSSISHSFPSELEAKVYLAGAGEEEFVFEA